jgi:hypothetical protein
MSTLFVVLLLVSFLGLVIGLIKPSWIKMPSRKRVGIIFGGAIVVFFVLVGITSPAAPAGSSTTPNPAQTTNATNSSPKLSDADYISSVQKNVLPDIQTAESDVVDPTTDLVSQDDWALSQEQKSQTAFLQAQTNLGLLHGQAPDDLSQADSLLNQGVNDQVSGINNIVTAVKNSMANVDDLTFIDPDAVAQGFASLEKSATEEDQAFSLMEATNTTSTTQIALLKKEQQDIIEGQVSADQAVETVLKPYQALKSSASGNISQLGGGIQASYENLRIEAADPDRPAGTTMITVNVNIGSILDKSALIDVANKLSAQLFQTVYSAGVKAYDVDVSYNGQTTDSYGNQHNNTPVLIYGLDKDTYQKINWSGFDQSTLCDFLKQRGTIEGGTGNDACNVLVNIQ